MPNKFRSVKEIDTSTNRWTAKVMVTEKGFRRTGMTSNKDFQRLILVDAEGTKIQASIFGDDIEILENTLQLFTAYSISNAVVKCIPIEHRLVINEYQWTISARTCIEEITDDQLTIHKFASNFVQLTDLEHYDHSPQDINVLFAVLQVAPTRKIKLKTVRDNARSEFSLQEVVIIDQSMKPIILTLWEQFGPNEGAAISSMPSQFPIVIGMRLKATNYNGLALSTKSGSTFIFNPPLPEGETLLNWCLAHEKEIRAIPLNKIHQVGNAQTPPPTANKIIAICQLPTSVDQPTFYWVQASAIVQNFHQKFWFMCCSKCNKGTDAEPDDIFQCNYCKKKAKPEPRCKFDVQLRDSSGDITATIFGAQAEKLFSINAQKWMESTSTIFDLLREQLWYRPNSGIYIKLIVMLGKCKQPEKAHSLFQAMIDEGCVVNHESYTALLSAYSRSGLFNKAFSLLAQMKNSPDCKPDVYTYSVLIKSCLQVFAFDKVENLLSDMASQGIKPNTITYNTLIDAYGKAKKFAKMESTLVEMLREGKCQPDVWTMNSALRAFGSSGQIETMEKCYEKFQCAGIQPNIKSFNVLLDSYGNGNGIRQEIHAEMEYMQKWKIGELS